MPANIYEGVAQARPHGFAGMRKESIFLDGRAGTEPLRHQSGVQKQQLSFFHLSKFVGFIPGIGDIRADNFSGSVGLGPEP